MEKTVSIRKIAEDLGLNVLAGEDNIDTETVLIEIHRPGIELTGYFGNPENEREIENSIHIISNKEMKYINSLPKHVKEYNLTHYFNYDFPCVIITGNLETCEEMLEIAKINSKPLLITDEPAEKFMKKLKKYLEKELAPEIVVNNFTLMEVYGTGILLVGDETAKIGTTLELLEKNHRFITDELLVIKKYSDDVLMGESSYNQNTEDYQYNMKLQTGERVSVIDYFGIGATRKSKQIELIVKFEKWDETKFYDRLGIDEETQYMLGVNVPKLTIPIRKGRNLGIIVQTAAINQRLKKSGQNSAIYFLEETKRLIKENSMRKSGGKNMENIKCVTVRSLKERYQLEVVTGDLYIMEEKKIISADIHRPSLEFAGFYDMLDEGGESRLQVIGESEVAYITKMSKEKIIKNLERYLSYNFPCIIFSGVKEIPPYFLDVAVAKEVVVLKTDEKIGDFTSELGEFLEKYFAPSTTVHGVLIEVFGFGVLLTGKSGIGKSETALDLIHRGHRLIADDMVRFTKYTDSRIIGTAEKVPYFMEIRGLGIIDIKTLYGLGAVRKSKQLDVEIELKELKEEEFHGKKEYQEVMVDFLEEKIPKIELWISSGRNAASMVEIATMNLRAKKVGYDSNEIYMRNYDNIKKITNKKENILQNIGSLISGGKRKNEI